MKNKILNTVFLGAAFVMSACGDGFLDVMPDSRAQIDTEDKVTALLVNAYPQRTYNALVEMASDNAMDNGALFSIEDRCLEDAYSWEPISTDGNDSPKSFWDACYAAVAAANQALASIEEMGSPESLNPQKGEALICRAYGHFLLGNLFCREYNPETANKDMGIPYSEAPETEVKPHYERGTMEELYAKISKDIDEALPLIDDNLYTVPKYHFNKDAAYAFAARFNLYYQKWDKVITYATEALGADPANKMRDWSDIVLNTAANWSARVDKYINASEPSNLLLCTAMSSWGYWGGPYNLSRRFGYSRPVCYGEGVRAKGPWGAAANFLPGYNMWGYSDSKLCVTKIGGYFEYTDKAAGIGYRRNVYSVFNADECILNRAEAYILTNQYDKAVEDINTWMYSHTRNHNQFTKDQLVEFYSGVKYMNPEATAESDRTIKKELHPRGFTVAEGEQENLIQCVLHLRRLDTTHEGIRWFDIKRYGIEIAHNHDGEGFDHLTVDDPRKAFQLPADVTSAGLDKNPRSDTDASQYIDNTPDTFSEIKIEK